MYLPDDPEPGLPQRAHWDHCNEIARHHGRSFYLANRLLPPARRRAVTATYAYCRIADDIVDSAPATGLDSAVEALAQWEHQLIEPTHPVAIAFAFARAEYGVPIDPVRDLILGISMDVTTTRYATWDDLRSYCYHVAGTVGLMVAPILGCRDNDALRHAADLGIAMQLTNILRDVKEDARIGRLYLPLDEIISFGCDPDAILAGQPGSRFPELMAFQIERARALYQSALIGVPYLVPSGRFATLAASGLYSRILNEIESLEYDVYRSRAYVPRRGKLSGIARASGTFLRMSVMSQEKLMGDART